MWCTGLVAIGSLLLRPEWDRWQWEHTSIWDIVVCNILSSNFVGAFISQPGRKTYPQWHYSQWAYNTTFYYCLKLQPVWPFPAGCPARRPFVWHCLPVEGKGCSGDGALGRTVPQPCLSFCYCDDMWAWWAVSGIPGIPRHSHIQWKWTFCYVMTWPSSLPLPAQLDRTGLDRQAWLWLCGSYLDCLLEPVSLPMTMLANY